MTDMNICTRRPGITKVKPGRRAHQGLTLIELMVVVALLGLLTAVVGPSMKQMVDMQRLQGINAQLMTDLHYARSEAVNRRAVVRMQFNSNDTQSCYTISTTTDRRDLCDCTNVPACPAGEQATELRTVIYPKSLGTTISVPRVAHQLFGFEPTQGGLVAVPIDRDPLPIEQIKIEPKIDTARAFRIHVVRTGRPSVCAPPGSNMKVPACPVEE